MSKPNAYNHFFKHHELTGYALAMTFFCLLTTWCIEFLAKELFRLG